MPLKARDRGRKKVPERRRKERSPWRAEGESKSKEGREENINTAEKTRSPNTAPHLGWRHMREGTGMLALV